MLMLRVAVCVIQFCYNLGCIYSTERAVGMADLGRAPRIEAKVSVIPTIWLPRKGAVVRGQTRYVIGRHLEIASSSRLHDGPKRPTGVGSNSPHAVEGRQVVRRVGEAAVGSGRRSQLFVSRHLGA